MGAFFAFYIKWQGWCVMKGYFISFEGPDGAGKTTIINELVQQLSSKTIAPILVTREPGGSKISENIRKIILDPKNKEMNAETEALLYAAARSQHVIETIIPALNAGKIVFSDRFIDSSLAYQGIGRDLGIDEIKQINEFATRHITPDLTLFFDIDPLKGLQRIQKVRPENEDRLEQENNLFHKKVYTGYKRLLSAYPERIKRVDAELSIAEVVSQSVKILEEYMPHMFK